MKISKATALLSAMVALVAASNAQADVIAHQGFDGAASDTWSYSFTTQATSGTGGSAGVSTDIASLFPKSSSTLDGNAFFDSNEIGTTMTFSSVNVSGYSNVSVNVPIASFSKSGADSNDATADMVQIFVSVDGAPFSSTADITLTGNQNSQWNFGATGVITTAAGTPTGKITAPYAGTTNSNLQDALLTVTLPASAQSVALKVFLTDSSNTPNTTFNEVWATDDVTITGTAVPEPASLSILAIGGGLLLRRRRSV